MVIREVFCEDSLQVVFVQDDHVVQTLSTDRAYDPLDEWILPWTSVGRYDLFDAHVLDAATERLAVDRVPIAQEEAWGFLIRECFNDLLCRPVGAGIRRDVEVDNTSLVVPKNQETIQHAKRNGGHGEEIDGGDLVGVVGQGRKAPGVALFKTALSRTMIMRLHKTKGE